MTVEEGWNQKAEEAKCMCVGNEIYRIVIVIVSIEFYLIGEASESRLDNGHVCMDDMQNWADGWGRMDVSRHRQNTLSLSPSFSSFLPSFFLLFLNGQNHRCNSVLHVKQAQPLLQVRFGEGPCPVGRPGMGRWFLMDDY